MYKLCLHLSLALFPVLLFGAAEPTASCGVQTQQRQWWWAGINSQVPIQRSGTTRSTMANSSQPTSTISSDGRIYPIVPTHGNHENADLQMMHNLFDTPHPDQYYALGLAGGLMRVWILNSELEDLAKEKEPAQQAWFESDLSQHESATPALRPDPSRATCPQRASKSS